MGRGSEEHVRSNVFDLRKRQASLVYPARYISSDEFIDDLDFDGSFHRSQIANTDYLQISRSIALSFAKDRQGTLYYNCDGHVMPLKTGVAVFRAYPRPFEDGPNPERMVIVPDLAELTKPALILLDRFSNSLSDVHTALIAEPSSRAYAEMSQFSTIGGVFLRDNMNTDQLRTFRRVENLSEYSTNEIVVTHQNRHDIFLYLDDSLRVAWSEYTESPIMTRKALLDRLRKHHGGKVMLDWLERCGFNHARYCELDPDAVV